MRSAIKPVKVPVVTAVRKRCHGGAKCRLPPLACAPATGSSRARARLGARCPGQSSRQAEVMGGAAASSTPWSATRARASSKAWTSLR
jgi:hypothetical protein